MKRPLLVFLVVMTLAPGALAAVKKGRAVLLDGKPLVSVYVVDGILVASAADFSAASSTRFRLRDGMLEAIIGEEGLRAGDQIIGEEGLMAVRQAVPAPNDAIVGEKGSKAAKRLKVTDALRAPQAKLKLQRAGKVSSKVMLRGTDVWVPLSDVMAAFGAVYEGKMASIAGTLPIRITVKRACVSCVFASE